MLKMYYILKLHSLYLSTGSRVSRILYWGAGVILGVYKYNKCVYNQAQTV